MLFGVAFTGSGEFAIRPTLQHASPAAVSSSARQNSLRSHRSAVNAQRTHSCPFRRSSSMRKTIKW